ncbi:MAG: hypothetical protein ACM3N5_07300, partial [Candidatus Eiseniibacteriota bacterium]
MLLSLSARRYGLAVTAALATSLGNAASPALAEGIPGTQTTPVPPELRREAPLPPPQPVPLAPGLVYGGVLTLTLESDQTLNRANGVSPFNNTYSEPELDWYVNAGKYFSVNGLFKMEQVRSETSSGAFKSEGAWAEQLYGTINLDPVQLYGGKIHPRFGRAWDDTPGVFGTDFAEDYELVEKLGVGAAVDMHWMGTHTLSFEAFQADTSFLSNSIFSRPKITDPDVLRPGRLHRDDGGVSNTGKPDNFAVALSGKAMPGMTGFTYTAGWAIQRGSDRVEGERNEQSFVLGGQWELPVSSRITAIPIVEYAHINNQGGADVRADYITTAVAFELGSGWSASVNATVKPVHDREAEDHHTD